MTRFTAENTKGYSARDLATLNVRFADAVQLPPDALAAMSDIEIKSWHDHCAEQVLADFDLVDEAKVGRDEAVRVRIRAWLQQRKTAQ